MSARVLAKLSDGREIHALHEVTWGAPLPPVAYTRSDAVRVRDWLKEADIPTVSVPVGDGGDVDALDEEWAALDLNEKVLLLAVLRAFRQRRAASAAALGF